MPTINFLLQTKAEIAPIYFRFRGQNLDIKVKTNYLIHQSNWDKKKNFPKTNGDEECKVLKAKLKLLESNVWDALNKEDHPSEIDSNWFKKVVGRELGVSKVDGDNSLFSTQVENYIAAKGAMLSNTVISKYRRTNDIVQEVGKLMKLKQVRIKDINWDFKKQYENYCSKQSYGMSYVGKIFKNIKTIGNFAYDNYDVETHQMLRAKVKFDEEESKAIYLTEEEIKKIAEFDFKNERLNNVRDWLVISCGTGARISDFMRFNASMIKRKNLGNGVKIRVIEYIQEKTKIEIISPIIRNSQLFYTLEKLGWNFPRRISSQKYNQYLKKIGELVGLDEVIEGDIFDSETKRKVRGHFKKFELLTSHIGRRSFATNYYGKIPTAQLIVLTGHKTESMLLKYIRKTSEEKNLEAIRHLELCHNI